MDRPRRVIIVHDIERRTRTGEPLRWAYANRSYALQQYEPDGWSVIRCDFATIPWFLFDDNAADILFVLDYAAAPRIRRSMKMADVDVPLVVSFNKDANSRHELFRQTVDVADWTIVNNMHRWATGGVQPRTCCISNGVDTRFWKPPANHEGRNAVVLWCGGTGHSKQKGWREVLEPLRVELPALRLRDDFRPIDSISEDTMFTPDQQLAWYQFGGYYLNASATEGTPSSMLEAMATGCVAVTTPIGNVLEFGIDRGNCVIVERSVQSFIRGLEYARDHWDKLSAASIATMKEWSYDRNHTSDAIGRADYFFALFDAILEHGVESIQPFTYVETDPWEIG